MGQEELQHHPRVNGLHCMGQLRRTTLFLSAALALVLVATPALAGKKSATKSRTTTSRRSTTTLAPADRPKTFCEAWAAVRDVRNSGLTGAASIRLQSERYNRLVPLAPAEIRPSAAIMAEYFAATLAMADKPLSNAKETARLEALIPKIGDALTTVTRHAVRTCPRSVVLATTTIVESPVESSGASRPNATTTTVGSTASTAKKK